jgi:hypothetical protein
VNLAALPERVQLPGSLSLRDAARAAWQSGRPLRVSWTPYFGLVIELVPMAADQLPSHLRGDRHHG